MSANTRQSKHGQCACLKRYVFENFTYIQLTNVHTSTNVLTKTTDITTKTAHSTKSVIMGSDAQRGNLSNSVRMKWNSK